MAQCMHPVFLINIAKPRDGERKKHGLTIENAQMIEHAALLTWLS